ncbi:MAG: hypothetical protein Q8P83_02390 [bacterium]|nr:hypothetical protein [bacterium]
MKGNKPFEDALKSFKPERKFVGEKNEARPSDSQAAVESSEIAVDTPKNPRLEQERMEDETLFAELVQLLALKESDRAFHRIRKMITDSRKYTVAFDVDRYLNWKIRGVNNPRAGEIAHLILKRGFIADAINWLKSMTPEGMRYGNGSKELRLENARGSAKAAGVSLEELARQHNLSI